MLTCTEGCWKLNFISKIVFLWNNLWPNFKLVFQSGRVNEWHSLFFGGWGVGERSFPGSPVVKTSQRARVWFLVGQLRAFLLHSAAKKQKIKSTKKHPEKNWGYIPSLSPSHNITIEKKYLGSQCSEFTHMLKPTLRKNEIPMTGIEPVIPKHSWFYPWETLGQVWRQLWLSQLRTAVGN